MTLAHCSAIIYPSERRAADFPRFLSMEKDEVEDHMADSLPDERIRFNRLKLRKRNRDPETLKEFNEQQKRELELFDFDYVFGKTDFAITNNDGLNELQTKIDAIIEANGINHMHSICCVRFCNCMLYFINPILSCNIVGK